ncbi:MAG: CPBP family intramembrane glutamic endopeptidase [Actinomycetota bacterium]
MESRDGSLSLKSRLKVAYYAYAQNRFARLALATITIGAAIASGGRPTLLVETLLALLLLDMYLGRAVRNREPLAGFGFPSTGALKGFVVGAIAAAAVITTTVVIFAIAGWYEVESFELDLIGFSYYTALFLGVSVAEEVLSRGMIWRFVERRAGTLLALVVSSLFFGLGHFLNPGATLWSGLAIALHAGGLLGAMFIATRSLWVPIGGHFAWNLFEGPILGTEVSGLDTDVLIEATTRGPEIWTGGAFGPEASVITVVLGVVPALVLLAYAWKRGKFRSREVTTSPVPSEPG